MSCPDYKYFIVTLLAVVSFFFAPQSVFSHAVTNLKAPQSIVVDSGQGYFISNTNGDPGNRDNKGFITKLDTDGEIIHLYFIRGGRDSTVLHSPQGMAIVEHTLYIADLDTVWGFDKNTGELIVSVSLAQHGCTSLTGLAADSSGRLFVSDPETNAIYRIDPQQEYAISLFVQNPSLSKPRGLAIHPRSQRLVGVGWNDGKVFEIDEHGTITELIANTFFSRRFSNLDGIDFDKYGSMYISDMTAGKIWRIHSDLKKQVIAEFLVSPAGLSIDREKHLILVPYVYANGVEINGLEQPANSGKKRKLRSLSDYGLNWQQKE